MRHLATPLIFGAAALAAALFPSSAHAQTAPTSTAILNLYDNRAGSSFADNNSQDHFLSHTSSPWTPFDLQTVFPRWYFKFASTTSPFVQYGHDNFVDVCYVSLDVRLSREDNTVEGTESSALRNVVPRLRMGSASGTAWIIADPLPGVQGITVTSTFVGAPRADPVVTYAFNPCVSVAIDDVVAFEFETQDTGLSTIGAEVRAWEVSDPDYPVVTNALPKFAINGTTTPAPSANWPYLTYDLLRRPTDDQGSVNPLTVQGTTNMRPRMTILGGTSPEATQWLGADLGVDIRCETGLSLSGIVCALKLWAVDTFTLLFVPTPNALNALDSIKTEASTRVPWGYYTLAAAAIMDGIEDNGTTSTVVMVEPVAGHPFALWDAQGIGDSTLWVNVGSLVRNGMALSIWATFFVWIWRLATGERDEG